MYYPIRSHTGLFKSKRSMAFCFYGFYLLISLLLSIDVKAEIERDDRLWITYQADYALRERLKAILQVQPYWREEMTHRDQITLRTGVLWIANETTHIGGGYAYNLAFTETHQTAHEQRLWEELGILIYAHNGLNIQERTRLEHRQFEHKGELATGVRQLIKVTYPLNGNVKLSISDELYFNLNTTSRLSSGFDQNRLFVGVLSPVTSNITLEVGYLNQYVNGLTADRVNHVLALSMTQSF